MADISKGKEEEFYPKLCGSTLFFTVYRLKKKKAPNQKLFVAKYKYTKLQDQNGQCCMSKKDKVASLTPE